MIKNQLERQSKSINNIVVSYPGVNALETHLNDLRNFIGLDDNPSDECNELLYQISLVNSRKKPFLQNIFPSLYLTHNFEKLRINAEYFKEHFTNICLPQIFIINQTVDNLLRLKLNQKHSSVLVRTQLDALVKDQSHEDADEAVKRLKSVIGIFDLTAKIITATITEIDIIPKPVS